MFHDYPLCVSGSGKERIASLFLSVESIEHNSYNWYHLPSCVLEDTFPEERERERERKRECVGAREPVFFFTRVNGAPWQLCARNLRRGSGESRIHLPRPSSCAGVIHSVLWTGRGLLGEHLRRFRSESPLRPLLRKSLQPKNHPSRESSVVFLFFFFFCSSTANFLI